MISVNDFKTGLTIQIDGELWRVVEFLHVKPGKGSAFVRSKLKNLRTGAVQEKTFRAGEKVEQAQIDRKEMQYLYRAGEKVEQAQIDRKEMQYLYADGDNYVFMDTSTYEQLELNKAQIEDEIKYLKENMLVKVIMHDSETLGLELPNTVDLVVAETEPNIKGDTSSGGSKPATMETGLVVQVPFFINKGDTLTINTSDGTYISRA